MNTQALTRIMVVFVGVVAPVELYSQEDPIPVSFTFHCGGKARNSVPRAMGFSPAGETLAVWYKRDLIFLAADSGRELQRIRTASSHLDTYNFVAFDPSGQFCCTAEVQLDGVKLHFIDIKNGRAAEPVAHTSQELNKRFQVLNGEYRSYGPTLPLREWLSFQTVADEADATISVIFPSSDRLEQMRTRFHVAFNGNRNLLKAEQIFSKMGGERTVEAARNIGGYVGSDMQVALSEDHRTLLTQYLKSHDRIFSSYRFCFLDVESQQKIAEIQIPTSSYWRHGVSRGFAFSQDLGKLARSISGGHVIVHDLSALVDRKVDVSDRVLKPANDSITVGSSR